MEPKEYIDSLKLPTGKRVTASDIPTWLKDEWEKGGGRLDDLVTSGNRDFAEYLLNRLTPRLPDELVELFRSGWIAVGAVENSSPNAYVKKVGPEGYAIVFNTGLKDFIYRVARILGTRFVPHPGIEGPSINTMNLEETARLIADVFWWFQETNSAAGPTYPIHQQQIQIANLLAFEAETFLLAHEIGHIIKDRHGESDHRLMIDLVPFSQSEEYVADILGLYLVMELHNPEAQRHPFTTPMIYAGAEFALQIYRGLELLGFEFEDSHPPAGERLQCIRSRMRAKCDSDESWQNLSGLAIGIEAVFSNILEIIRDPSEHAEFFNREAQQVVTELNRLLDSCTGGRVPNYGGFYQAAGELFERGYSHKMLERITQVAGDFFSDAERLRDNDAESDPQSWVRFQKFKLLLGYSKEMNEPARSLFLEALGMRPD